MPVVERESSSWLRTLWGRRGVWFGSLMCWSVWVWAHQISYVFLAVLPDLLVQVAASFKRQTGREYRGRFVHWRWYSYPTQQTPLFLLRRGSLFEEDYPWIVPLKAEVMVPFDTIQAAEMGRKKPGPISGRHDGTTILGTDQLADVTCRTPRLHDPSRPES